MISLSLRKISTNVTGPKEGIYNELTQQQTIWSVRDIKLKLNIPSNKQLES